MSCPLPFSMPSSLPPGVRPGPETGGNDAGTPTIAKAEDRPERGS